MSPRNTMTIFAVLFMLLAAAPAQPRHAAYEGVLGTSLDLWAEGVDEESMRAIEAAVLAEIRRLDQILSAWVEDSEWMRFRRGKGRRTVSPELFAVLSACDRWYASSGGAFDAGASGRANGAAPTDPRLWALDEGSRQARMLVRHEVSVDGLAKGYVVDLALTAARRAAPKAAKLVIDIGGDLVVQGARPHAVAITDPRRPADNAPPLCVLAIKERAVATSGGYERSAKGAPGSHIVDPDTGKPVERVVSASVIASKCVDADAIATALNVMEPARGIAWVSALANVECLVVDARGGIHESPGFAGFCTQRTASSDVETAPAPPRSIASTDHVVTFVFELAKPEGSGRPYRRPYVAAWVAKPGEEKPVRALCLWIEQQRWMRDLKVWYRLYRKEKKLIRSLTRATRRSGRYSLTWDGRDEDGTSLPCGTYEIHLEVAREHGTHQHLKAEVRVEKHTIAVKLEPNVEVAGAVIHVHPRGKKPE